MDHGDGALGQVIAPGAAHVISDHQGREGAENPGADAVEQLDTDQPEAHCWSDAPLTAGGGRMKVEDLRPRSAGWTIRLHGKGGKQHSMPCHHALAEA